MSGRRRHGYHLVLFVGKSANHWRTTLLGMFTVQQVIFFVILVVAFGLLLTEKLRNDLVAILIILALAITGVLKPSEALAGFGSEAAIVVAAIFVLSAGLQQT